MLQLWNMLASALGNSSILSKALLAAYFVCIFFPSFAFSNCSNLSSKINSACQPKFLLDVMAIKRSAQPLQACIAGDKIAHGSARLSVGATGQSTIGGYNSVEGLAGGMENFNNNATTAYNQCANLLPPDVGDTATCKQAIAELRNYCTQSAVAALNAGNKSKQLKKASGDLTRANSQSIDLGESVKLNGIEGNSWSEMWQGGRDPNISTMNNQKPIFPEAQTLSVNPDFNFNSTSPTPDIGNGASDLAVDPLSDL